jgi:uncharacterized membrane protein YgaE (UPF0421/DUF939 family)
MLHCIQHDTQYTMNDQLKRLFIYIAKILCGTLLSFGIAHFFPLFDFGWIVISTFLVLSPEGKDAVDVALIRIKANFVGAGTGLILLAFHLPILVSICIGAAISLIFCEFLKLSLGAKSTLAAVAIVLMNSDQNNFWSSPLHRVSSVFIGCILALIITYLFHSILKVETPTIGNKTEDEKEEREG